MTPLTRAQREALAAVYRRGPCYLTNERFPSVTCNPAYARETLPSSYDPKPISYLQFRRQVHPGSSYDPCLMLRWTGMWLGIEPDGYTHS